MSVAFIVVALLVVVVVVFVALRVRRGRDPVDSFRRQIDALSPEARRPTIDQVKAVDDEDDESDTT